MFRLTVLPLDLVNSPHPQPKTPPNLKYAVDCMIWNITSGGWSNGINSGSWSEFAALDPRLLLRVMIKIIIEGLECKIT